MLSAPSARSPKKDFTSDQETRWCPGCGDYAVLAAVQQLMPELGIPPHRIVFVSGIGCAGRFAYYMDTYGMHGIHGRAPALATGLAAARNDLSIWVVTGDGDALSIGGNHLIHALRRNVPLKILMFNNQVYGLTKGQASPTSERGMVTKSTPFGAAGRAVQPARAGARRGGDVRRPHGRPRPPPHDRRPARRGAEHEGSAFVEIYQNCPVFNDGAFFALTEKDRAVFNRIPLVHGEPIRFGPDGEHGVARAADGDLADRRPATATTSSSTTPTATTRRSRSRSPASPTRPNDPTPIGVFRAVDRPRRHHRGRPQARRRARRGSPRARSTSCCTRGDTWTVA